MALTWAFVAPLLPLIFLVAPAVWRNICPLALVNQLPRLGGFSRGRQLPPTVARHVFTAAALCFVAIVTLRRVLLDRSGPATAALIVTGLVLAFAGGVAIQGKAGWCGTVCPLFAAQRLYGRAPVVRTSHAHCQPCVGCVRTCVDVNPTGAAAFEDSGAPGARARQLLVGAAPGLAIGYVAVPDPLGVPVAGPATAVLAPALASAVVYLVATGTPAAVRHRHTITSGFAAVAFAAFYALSIPRLANAWGVDQPLLEAGLQVLAVMGAATWWVRDQLSQEASIARRAARGKRRAATSGRTGTEPQRAVVRVTAADGSPRPVTVEVGETLAVSARHCGVPLPGGCGAGTCGADPVTVLDGHDHLNPPEREEQATLRRLGAPESTRLACVARVTGDVAVTLRSPARMPAGGIDATVRSVVVVGNGIAGLTAARGVRRLHPDCEVHLVGREPHHTYNRMALAELVAGDGELTRLGLLPPTWLAEQGITTHIGTRAAALDLKGHVVALDSEERLGFDRLILATGATPSELPLAGLPLAGAYTLWTAEQALAVREYAATHHDLRTAVVVGAGPLGIEAALALRALDLDVHLVDRHGWPAWRLIDEQAGRLVEEELAGLGIKLHSGADVRWANGARQVTSVRLGGGVRIPCDLLLLCTGTRPDVALARSAGLRIRRGIVVDSTLRTSHPDVFAVGDAAEHPSGVSGLWYAAVDQAEIAAEQAVAAVRTTARRYLPGPFVTRLNLPGLDVVSMGRVRDQSEPGKNAPSQVVVVEDEPGRRYLRVRLSGSGSATGAVVVGDPEWAATIESLIHQGVDLRRHLRKLRAGKLASLAPLVSAKAREAVETSASAALASASAASTSALAEAVSRVRKDRPPAEGGPTRRS